MQIILLVNHSSTTAISSGARSTGDSTAPETRRFLGLLVRLSGMKIITVRTCHADLEGYAKTGWILTHDIFHDTSVRILPSILCAAYGEGTL